MCLCVLCVCVCVCVCVCMRVMCCKESSSIQRVVVQCNRHMELTVVAVWNANLLPDSLT